MSWSILQDVPNPHIDANGDPYSGAVLKCFLPGTTTPTSIAIDSAGSSPQASITYNAEGKLEVSGNEILPYIDRKAKWGIFANSTDAAANAPFQTGPFDNVDIMATKNDTAFAKNFATLALAVADTGLVDGDALNIAERTTGSGGGAMWDVALASTVTENTFNIVQCTGVPTLSLVLRVEGAANVKQFGAIGDDTNDDAPAVEAADDYSALHRVPVFFPPGGYKFFTTVVRNTQSAWYGLAKQSSYNINNETHIFGKEEDIGDGNPVVRCAPSSFSGGVTLNSSISFENLEFISDKVVVAGSLDTTDSTGVSLVDISFVKNGLDFIGCGFKNAAIGIHQSDTDPFTGKLSIPNCNFNLLFRAIDANPSTGISLTNTLIYDCFDFIESTTDVTLIGCAINNSSFASENTSVKAATISMVGGWIEGGNRVLKPSVYCLMEQVKCSETSSGSGTTKFLIEPQNDNVTIIVKGSRIPTNTRLVDLSSVDVKTIFMDVSGVYDGTSFSDASDINSQLAAGLNYRGFGNVNTDTWNVPENQYTQIYSTAHVLDRTDSGKVIYQTSTGINTFTIPANSLIPFPIGTQIEIVNASNGGILTLAINTDSLEWGAQTSTRMLAASATGYLRKISQTTWRLTGEGIT